MSLEKLEAADAADDLARARGAIRLVAQNVRFPMVPIKVADGLRFQLTDEAVEQLADEAEALWRTLSVTVKAHG